MLHVHGQIFWFDCVFNFRTTSLTHTWNWPQHLWSRNYSSVLFVDFLFRYPPSDTLSTHSDRSCSVSGDAWRKQICFLLIFGGKLCIGHFLCLWNILCWKHCQVELWDCEFQFFACKIWLVTLRRTSHKWWEKWKWCVYRLWSHERILMFIDYPLCILRWNRL